MNTKYSNHIRTYSSENTKNKMITIVVIIAALVSFLWSNSAFNWSTIFHNSIRTNMLDALIHPDFEYVFAEDGLIWKIIETLLIAFLGVTLSVIISLPISLLGSYKILNRFSAIFKAIFVIIRTFPPIVVGIFMIKTVGPGAAAGVFTIAIHSSGIMMKLIAEAIDEIDQNVIDNLASTGLNKLEIFTYGYFPQIMSNFFSIILFRFEISLRDASTLGIVGAGGIGVPLLTAIQTLTWNRVSIIIIAMVITTFIVDNISTKIRRKINN